MEFPDIESAVVEGFEGEDVRVYGLYEGESADLLLDFREQTGVTFPFMEGQYSLNRFAFPAGVGYPYPRDIVVGRDLVIRSIRNSFNVEEMEQLIAELLAEPAP